MAKKAVKKTKKVTQAAKRGSPGPIAKKAANTTTRSASPPAEPLTHRLETLLHTMRCIAQHEDELCSLLHNARRTGRFSAPMLRELHAVLEDLPAEEYTYDLDAVRHMTEGL